VTPPCSYCKLKHYIFVWRYGTSGSFKLPKGASEQSTVIKKKVIYDHLWFAHVMMR